TIVTNNSRQTPSVAAAFYRAIGLPVRDTNVSTAAQAMAAYIASHQERGRPRGHRRRAALPVGSGRPRPGAELRQAPPRLGRGPPRRALRRREPRPDHPERDRRDPGRRRDRRGDPGRQRRRADQHRQAWARDDAAGRPRYGRDAGHGGPPRRPHRLRRARRAAGRDGRRAGRDGRSHPPRRRRPTARRTARRRRRRPTGHNEVVGAMTSTDARAGHGASSKTAPRVDVTERTRGAANGVLWLGTQLLGAGLVVFSLPAIVAPGRFGRLFGLPVSGHPAESVVYR